MILTPAARRFVHHWGEMGPSWGINRTMAQVHALLFVSPDALDAEEISKLLELSRSNVSVGLRDLLGWGIVRRVHIIGDRRDRFEAIKDVLETFRIILAERKRREVDPTVEVLRHCIAEAEAQGDADEYTRRQMAAMFEFCRLVTDWYDQVEQLPSPSLGALLRNGGKLTRLFGHFSRPVSPEADPD